jgi:hypothetical protein
MPKSFGEFDDAKTAAIPLLGVPPFAHDHTNKDLNVWAEVSSLLADAFGRPVFAESVVCRHVVLERRVLTVTRALGVRGNALSLKIYFYRACGNPCP